MIGNARESSKGAKTEGGRKRGWDEGKQGADYDHPLDEGGAKGKSGMDVFAFSSELLRPL